MDDLYQPGQQRTYEHLTEEEYYILELLLEVPQRDGLSVEELLGHRYGRTGRMLRTGEIEDALFSLLARRLVMLKAGKYQAA